MKDSSLLFVSILFMCIQVSAQQERILVSGQILNDSIPLENIHIINKTSKKAVISGKKGIFKIRVKENDELFISSLQFKDKITIIKDINIKTLKLIIKLEKSINTLDEVTVIKTKSTAENLGLPNADKKPLNKIEGNLNAHTKSNLPISVLATLLNKRGGINDLIYIVSGKRKKDRKLNQLLQRDAFEKNQLLKVQGIRAYLSDSFFIETLKIPSQNIDDFIMYCISQKTSAAYLNKSELEAIEFMILHSEGYLKELKDEK